MRKRDQSVRRFIDPTLYVEFSYPHRPSIMGEWRRVLSRGILSPTCGIDHLGENVTSDLPQTLRVGEVICERFRRRYDCCCASSPQTTAAHISGSPTLFLAFVLSISSPSCKRSVLTAEELWLSHAVLNPIQNTFSLNRLDGPQRPPKNQRLNRFQTHPNTTFPGFQRTTVDRVRRVRLQSTVNRDVP